MRVSKNWQSTVGEALEPLNSNDDGRYKNVKSPLSIYRILIEINFMIAGHRIESSHLN